MKPGALEEDPVKFRSERGEARKAVRVGKNTQVL